MTDVQLWLMSYTVVMIFALTIVYKTAIYAIMRSTDKDQRHYSGSREKDQ